MIAYILAFVISTGSLTYAQDPAAQAPPAKTSGAKAKGSSKPKKGKKAKKPKVDKPSPDGVVDAASAGERDAQDSEEVERPDKVTWRAHPTLQLGPLRLAGEAKFQEDFHNWYPDPTSRRA